MIRFVYIGDNARLQSVYDITDGAEIIGQICDRGRQGYRVFIGTSYADFFNIPQMMRYLRAYLRAETP